MRFILNEALEDDAKEEFGTTFSFDEAGFLLQDGTLLDFSGRKFGSRGGERTMDHREISSVYDTEFDIATEYLVNFMNRGNIRLMGGVGIDLVIEPTDAQYRVLRRYIDKYVFRNKEFNVDISDTKGYHIESKYYEGQNARSSIIIADIQNYFKGKNNEV